MKLISNLFLSNSVLNSTRIESLFKNFPDFNQNNTRIAVFGKNTAKAAKDAGLIINIEAPLPKIRSMSEAIDLYIDKSNKAKA